MGEGEGEGEDEGEGKDEGVAWRCVPMLHSALPLPNLP